jgi:uncharacterized protein (DUF1684 family)
MDEYLQLAEWRRTVAEIYARWRRESESDPEAAWRTWRDARDELFRSHPQSPLPQDQRARFGGLSYFPYDPSYRMTARVEPADAPQPQPAAELPALPGLDFGADAGAAAVMQLPSSGATPFSFRRIGRVALSGPLAGQSLPVFWMEGYAGGLFIPFRDATSGTDTYAAGRYLLDTVKGADQGGDPASRTLVLDFNLAYHPSCTYDPKWNCPLAPPDSRLTLPVTAGERLGESPTHS